MKTKPTPLVKKTITASHAATTELRRKASPRPDKQKKSYAKVPVSLTETKRLSSDKKMHQSELKRKNEELTKLKAGGLHDQLAAIVESSDDAIIGKTLDGIITSWNGGAKKIYGYSASEVIGKPISILIPPDLPNELPKILKRLKLGNSIPHFETTRLRKNGQRIDVAVSILPIKDSTGKITGASTIARDITERKNAGQELKESEERFHLLFENSPDAIMLIDPYSAPEPWVIVDCNEAAGRINGYRREELIGKSVEILNTTNNTAQDHTEYLKHLRDSGTITFEAEHRRRDNTIFSIEVRSSIITIGGHELVLGIDRDITKRKQIELERNVAEARYRSLLERLPIVVYVNPADDPGSTTFVSPQIQSMLGYSPEEWLADPKFWSKRLYPEDRDRVLAEIERIKITGEVLRIEYRMVAQDDHIVWVQDEVASVQDERGNTQFWQGLMLDITERKQEEQARHEAEIRYHSLVDQLPIVIYINPADDPFSTTYVSPQIQTMLGYSPKEWLEEPSFWSKTLPAEDLERVLAEGARAKATGESLDIEYRMHTRDGREIWVRDLFVLIRDSNGSPEFWQGMMIDITEGKRALIVQKEQEFWLQESQRAGRIGSYSFDLEKNIWVSSDVLDDIFGIDKDFERTLTSWNTLVHPEQQNEMIDYVIHHVVEGRNPFNLEYRIVRVRDGQVRWVWGQGELKLDESGNPLQLFGTIQDITERMQTQFTLKESEQGFSSAFESAPIGMSLVSPEGRILKANQALCNFLGYSLDEITSLTFQEITYPDDLNADLQYVEQLLAGSLQSYQMEKRYRHKLGHFVWAALSVSLVRNDAGLPVHFISQVKDITEGKQAEEALLKSEERYRLLFENMPIAIWEEDFSQAKKYVDALKDQGVKDFRAYFAAHPEAVAKTASMIRVLDTNDAALEMYGAKNKGELIRSTQENVSTGELELIRESLIAIAYGMNSNRWEGTDETMDGTPIDINLNWAVIPGHEQDYSRAIVITTDITERKQAEQKLRESETHYRGLFEDSPISLWEEDFSAVKARLDDLRTQGVTDFDDFLGSHPEVVAECAALVKILNVNKATLELHHAKSKQDLLLNLSRVFNDQSYEIFRDELVNIAEGITEFSWEAINQTLDGQQLNVNLSWSAVPGREQDLSKVIVSIIDITERKNTEKQIERRVLELEALYQSGIAFSQTLDRQDIGEKVIEVLSGNLDWHHAAVRVRHGDSDIVELLASIHTGVNVDSSLRMQSAVTRVGEGLSGWVIKHGKPVRINNLANDPRYVNTFDGMKSGLYVPMRIHDKTIGCISAESDQLNAFTEEDEHLLSTLATQAAVAIQNAELFAGIEDELARRRQAEERNLHQLERLTALQEINKAITSTVDLQERLNALLIQTRRILATDATTVLFLDPELKTLEYKASLGFRTNHEEMTRLHVGESYAGKVALEQHLVQVPDLALESKILFLPGFLEGEDFVSYYGAPLTVKGKVIGVLEVFNRSVIERDSEWLDFFETIAELAAIAIDNANLFEMFKRELAERKMAEEALWKSYAELERRVEERTADLQRVNVDLEYALQTKDEFLANMSHELRTPLNAIIGLSESLSEQVAGSLNAKQHRYIQTIGESGHHLLTLINDILDLAKIDAGHLDLNINPIHVKSLCESSMRMIKELAQKKSLNLSFQMAPTITNISGDERRLKQALVNLLMNAVKFTPVGGNIGLEVLAHAQEHLITFTVWDSGIGIEPEKIQLLFQPFVQLDGGLTREYAGTGLGLVLVRQMVQMHGGTVKVESEKGRGSRFTISLPWVLESTFKAERALPGPSQASPQIEERSGGVILLVEDTEDIIDLLHDYLIHKGYTVLEARNGAEGVSLALREYPQLILMDVMMPVMDGVEATRRIRMEPSLKNIPIIGLTSLAMPGDREKCIEAGMNDYISKPVELKELTSMINQYLAINKQEIK